MADNSVTPIDSLKSTFLERTCMPLVLKTVSFQANSMGAAAEKVFDEIGGTFGRGASCTWVLPDPERYISGTHGRVFCEDGRFFVEDKSTNGLIIEGQLSPIGNGNSVPLSHGDILLLGEFRLEVSLDESAVGKAEVGYDSPAVSVSPDPAADQYRDPLGFIQPVPESPSDPIPQLEDMEGHSSELQDHFTPPPMVNDGEFPATDPAQSAPEAPPPEPTPPAEVSPNDDSEGLIGEDWDRTQFGTVDPELVELAKSAQITSISERVSEPVDEVGPEIVPQEQGSSEPWSEPPPERDVSPEFSPVPERENIPPAELPTGSFRSPGEDSPGDSALYEAFLKGLGVPDLASAGTSTEAMRSYGTILRLVIGSLMDLLRSRASFKNEFRMEKTQIKVAENNPLKFSVSEEEALRIFLGPATAGYLDLEKSVHGTMTDMKSHQLAMVSGLQAVFHEFSKLMDPETYATESGEGIKALLAPRSKKSRNWDRFCENSERLGSASASGVSGHFSEVFAEAYEDSLDTHADMDR